MQNDIKLFLCTVGAILTLQGCTSKESAVAQKIQKTPINVVDFNTALKAYEQDKNLENLENLEKYAKTSKQKSLLERKLVYYMGSNRVFFVDIKDKLSDKYINTSTSYYLGDSQSVYKKNNLSIRIYPNPNLPFKLKYNTYNIELGITQNADYGPLREKYQISTSSESKFVYIDKKIKLGPHNNWSLSKKVSTDKILLFKKSASFGSGKSTKALLHLSYRPTYGIKGSNLIDYQNNLIWENDFAFNGGYPIISKIKNANNITRCKEELGIEWRLPYESELRNIQNNGSFIDKLVTRYPVVQEDRHALQGVILCVKKLPEEFIYKKLTVTSQEDTK